MKRGVKIKAVGRKERGCRFLYRMLAFLFCIMGIRASGITSHNCWRPSRYLMLQPFLGPSLGKYLEHLGSTSPLVPLVGAAEPQGSFFGSFLGHLLNTQLQQALSKNRLSFLNSILAQFPKFPNLMLYTDSIWWSHGSSQNLLFFLKVVAKHLVLSLVHWLYLRIMSIHLCLFLEQCSPLCRVFLLTVSKHLCYYFLTWADRMSSIATVRTNKKPSLIHGPVSEISTGMPFFS